jgi:hypothetical protein
MQATVLDDLIMHHAEKTPERGSRGRTLVYKLTCAKDYRDIHKQVNNFLKPL